MSTVVVDIVVVVVVGLEGWVHGGGGGDMAGRWSWL